MIDLTSKYKPYTWNSIMGQPHVTTSLQKAVEEERASNAYMFSGPHGVGKKSVIVQLAKSLGHLGIIKAPVTNNIFTTWTDLDELRPQSSSNYLILMEDEFLLRETEDYPAIIPVAELLKHIPKWATVVINTTEPHKIDPAIRRLTEHYVFHLLPGQQIRDHLFSVAKAEGAYDEDSDDATYVAGHIEAITAISGGSMKKALTDLGTVISNGCIFV